MQEFAGTKVILNQLITVPENFINNVKDKAIEFFGENWQIVLNLHQPVNLSIDDQETAAHNELKAQFAESAEFQTILKYYPEAKISD